MSLMSRSASPMTFLSLSRLLIRETIESCRCSVKGSLIVVGVEVVLPRVCFERDKLKSGVGSELISSMDKGRIVGGHVAKLGCFVFVVFVVVVAEEEESK